jgi:hypothetical protein
MELIAVTGSQAPMLLKTGLIAVTGSQVPLMYSKSYWNTMKLIKKQLSASYVIKATASKSLKEQASPGGFHQRRRSQPWGLPIR